MGRKSQEENGLGKAKRNAVNTPDFASHGEHVLGSHQDGDLEEKWFADVQPQDIIEQKMAGQV